MKNILVYGDSNTWGYDSSRYVPEADAFQRMDETERWPAAAGAGTRGTELISAETRFTQSG